MGIVRVAFLFDYKSFGRTITPVLDSIKRKEFNELRNLANEVMVDRPQVWKLLDYLTYFPSVLGNEEKIFKSSDGKVAFWIDIIICYFCSTFESLTDSEPAPEELEQLGVDKDIITTLIWGKPIGDLLLSLIVLDDNPNNYPFWNLGFKVGWLSTEDIEHIKTKIQMYNEASSNPAFENLLKIFDVAIESKMGLILSAIP